MPATSVDNAFLGHVRKKPAKPAAGGLNRRTATRAEDVSLEVSSGPADPFLDRLAESNKEYVRLFRKASLIESEGGFEDVRQLGAVRRPGCLDKQGREIFLFFPGVLRREDNLERIVMFGILQMHDPVVRRNRPYTAIWVCNNLEQSQLGFFWFRRQYKMVPDAYRKNMRCLALVHPGLGVRAVLLMLSYLVKYNFWEKLVYADRIEFLDEVVEPKKLGLPRSLYQYDQFLDAEMKRMAEQSQYASQGSGALFGMPGIGAGAGMMPDTSDFLNAGSQAAFNAHQEGRSEWADHLRAVRPKGEEASLLRPSASKPYESEEESEDEDRLEDVAATDEGAAAEEEDEGEEYED